MGGWGSVLQPPFFPTSLKPLVCCYVGLVDMWASLRKNKEVSTLANVGWTKNSCVSLCVKNCLCVSVCVRGGVKSWEQMFKLEPFSLQSDSPRQGV